MVSHEIPLPLHCAPGLFDDSRCPGGVTAGLTTKTADFGNLTWKSFDLATMTIGSAATLNSLDLTGIGFYSSQPINSTARFDDLTLVPEPSIAVMGGLGGLVCLRRRR
jgi:hypothetical protein